MSKKASGNLDDYEKTIVKALLDKKYRNQDIQYLVNSGREATINSARITEVKKNPTQKKASEKDVALFFKRKNTYNPVTGLNLVDHERLIRSREAMCLAVQVFNSPSTKFKTELFSILANIAWTYLIHEYYEKKGISIKNDNGKTIALSTLIARSDCPLSSGIINNLKVLKEIRDTVEHKLFGESDFNWLTLFQACCLNFDKTLCNVFGKKLTIKHELAVALQFGKFDLDSAGTLMNYDIPEYIQSLDANLQSKLTESELADLEYRFRIIYTLDSSSKGHSHIQFLNPESAEGKEIRNVLVKTKHAENDYPFKPSKVCQLISARTGKKYTMASHTKAWKKHKVRPNCHSKTPEITNTQFCIYHTVHKDYTYNQKWIDLLISEI